MASSDTATLSEAPSVPSEITGVVPYLMQKDASAAAEFYGRAFGATEVTRMPSPDGKRVMHCQLTINGGAFMMSDTYAEGHHFEPPEGVMLHLQVADAQAWWDRAIAAGCQSILDMQVMFWGARYGQLTDPFGFTWTIGGAA